MKAFLVCCTLVLISTAYSQDSIIESYAVTVNTDLPPKERKMFNHTYGPLSISTNLTSLLSISPYNRRWTIEPEYQFTDRLSLKVPLVIGFDKAHNIGAPESVPAYYSYDTYSNANFDPNSIPDIEYLPRRSYEIDVIAQVGVSPKYYFNGKSKSFFSFYGSAAFNVGIADQYSLHLYDQLDSSSYYSSSQQSDVYLWNVQGRTEEYNSDEFIYFNHELLLGVDYNFSRRVTCTFEMGYSSRFYGRPEQQDRLYTSILGNDYVLMHDGPFPTSSDSNRNLRFRLLLTARF